jgi:hypothetical protein
VINLSKPPWDTVELSGTLLMNGEKNRLRSRLGVVCICISSVVIGTPRAGAVLFQSTDDPTFNTTAPSGVLTNSGWQYQGLWLNFLGTPIAPQFFIVANHVGGTTNDVFLFNGLPYHPIAAFKTFDSDLTIWQVRETFPSYAPLYSSSDETNKHLVVFGRGTQRGAPVVVGGQTNGWYWGTPDGVQRWGENDVASVTNLGVGVGDMLRVVFDGNGGSNECHLSDGDSSGGVFIQDNGVWKLAGINHGVDGEFSNDVDGTTFTAALTDRRELFQQDGPDPSDWILIDDTQPVPSAFYSTRISANLDWIYSVIDFNLGRDLPTPTTLRIGNDVLVSFVTDSNRFYFVQQTTNAVDGAWTTFTNNVPGTGGTVTVVDPNAATFPARYYRLGFAQ